MTDAADPIQDPFGSSDDVAGPGRGPDRRQRPTPMFSRYTFRGRRRAGRREGERNYVYVDRPGPWVLAAFIVIVGLSSLDAYYTLTLINNGHATEANPLMKAALDLGSDVFVWVKTVMTILAAGFLCLHKNWPLGRACLVFAMLGYSVLVLYHLFAQRHVHEVTSQMIGLLGG